MDQSIEQVYKSCSKQLDEFQRCLLANRKDLDGGLKSCDFQRHNLSQCASNAVPLVSLVKKQCKNQLQAYDACMQAGKNDSDEEISIRCTPVLKDLWQCTDAVKRKDLQDKGQIPKADFGYKE